MPVVLDWNFKGCLFVIGCIRIMIGNSYIFSGNLDNCFLALIEGVFVFFVLCTIVHDK